MINYERILKSLGLPKHSGKIYELLHNSNPLLITEISERLLVSRPAIYKALGVLEQHHFAFRTIHGKRTYYRAANPSLITDAFEAVKTELKKYQSKNGSKKESHHYEEFTFLYGDKGIQEAFDDAIKNSQRGETFYRYTSEKDLTEVNSYLSKDYRQKRDSKKLERLVISNPESGNQKRLRLERFIKCIPKEFDQFQQNIIQLIYGDRISFIDLNKKFVVIINNKSIADFQKIIFKTLYKRL